MNNSIKVIRIYTPGEKKVLLWAGGRKAGMSKNDYYIRSMIFHMWQQIGMLTIFSDQAEAMKNIFNNKVNFKKILNPSC
jgi:hypothetical protein